MGITRSDLGFFTQSNEFNQFKRMRIVHSDALDRTECNHGSIR